jgi:hypothetical protein
MKIRLRLDALEAREMPAVTIGDPSEAYSWMLINEMRRDPADFADRLDGLRRGTMESAFGFSRTDPVIRDLRRLLNYARWPAHYQQAMDFLRAAPPVGPLAWDDVLFDRAENHVDWMRTHSFEHTAQDHERKRYIPGFRTGYRGGDPDTWGYNPGLYHWWGENIGYTYGLMANSKAAYSAHRFGQVGFHQRAAFIDTISYILEVNSPDMAHLEQLLRSDAAPDAGSPHYNAIGVDVDYFEGPYETRDGLGEATISTHRLGLYRPGGSGGFLTGAIFRDGNGNGSFDAAEGTDATVVVTGPVTFTDSISRLGSHGVYSRYVPNGTYVISAATRDGITLGTTTLTINSANTWFEFRDTRPPSEQAELTIRPPDAPVRLRPVLSWNEMPDAVSYEIRLADRSTKRANIFPGTKTSVPAWQPPIDLVPGRSYRALLRPIRPYMDGEWVTADFRVETPVVAAPPTVDALRPVIQWTAVPGAAAYDLILRDRASGRRIAFVSVDAAATSWTPPADLVSGRDYSVKVRALNNAGLGRWGSAATFTVATPRLLGPIGEVDTRRPTFSWSAITDASTYAIVVDDLTAGRRSLFRESTTSNSWVPPIDLTAVHTYRWRVVAQNSSGIGRWSAPATFVLN